MYQRGNWIGLRSIRMEKKTLRKGKERKEEYRYYISLGEDIELFSRQ